MHENLILIPCEWKKEKKNTAEDVNHTEFISDIDAQIQRCHERIEDNIMPFIFEERLKEYQLGKAARE